jgi:hypothetical protein
LASTTAAMVEELLFLATSTERNRLRLRLPSVQVISIEGERALNEEVPEIFRGVGQVEAIFPTLGHQEILLECLQYVKVVDVLRGVVERFLILSPTDGAPKILVLHLVIPGQELVEVLGG